MTQTELYKSKRESKDFALFLKRIGELGISFSEDEDNGIFIRGNVKHNISKNMLYRESGIARTWKISKESKALLKGKNIDEDFIPMLDDEFYSVYIKSILLKMFKIE